MDVTRDWLRELLPEMEWQVDLLAEEFAKLATALAAAASARSAAEGYIAKIEAIRGKKLGVPCCCDFADDDETPNVECNYHRAIREERDAAIARADAAEASDRESLEMYRRARDRADALAARLAEVDGEHPA